MAISGSPFPASGSDGAAGHLALAPSLPLPPPVFLRERQLTSRQTKKEKEERRGGAGGGGGEGEGDLWCRAAALVVRHAALRRRYLLLHEGNVIISDILNRGLSSFAFSVS